MECETKGTDYSLGEFYKAYKEKLPIVVMVTQGFCGEILAETLGYGLVLRIDRTFSQRRVIAVRLNDHGAEESTYSFPVDYSDKFCLDEGPYQTEIAKYKSNYLSKLVSKENVVHDFMYENFEPQTYTNVKELLASVRSSELETADDNNEYEPIEQCSSGNRNDNEKGKKAVQKPTAEDTKDQDQSNKDHKTLFGEIKDLLKKVRNPVEKTDASSQPPKISPKPKVNMNASGFIFQGQNREPNLSGDTFDTFVYSPPPVPPRLPSGPPTELDNMKAIPLGHEDSYENLKYRAEVPPMPNLQPGSTPLNEEIPVRIRLTGIQTLNLQQVNDRDNAGTINVKVLKVDDLGRWIAEKLRLGKYVDRFAEELVDGATLLDLD